MNIHDLSPTDLMGIVSLIIAFVSLLFGIFSLTTSLSANRISKNANEKSDEANELSRQNLLIVTQQARSDEHAEFPKKLKELETACAENLHNLKFHAWCLLSFIVRLIDAHKILDSKRRFLGLYSYHYFCDDVAKHLSLRFTNSAAEHTLYELFSFLEDFGKDQSRSPEKLYPLMNIENHTDSYDQYFVEKLEILSNARDFLTNENLITILDDVLESDQLRGFLDEFRKVRPMIITTIDSLASVINLNKLQEFEMAEKLSQQYRKRIGELTIISACGFDGSMYSNGHQIEAWGYIEWILFGNYSNIGTKKLKQNNPLAYLVFIGIFAHVTYRFPS